MILRKDFGQSGLHDPARVDALSLAEFDRMRGIKAYRMDVLGTVGGYPIRLFTPEQFQKDKPNLLIIGSIHGDEPAPAWGILDFLTNASRDDLRAANTSFIVLANPRGFSLNRRESDIGGRDPNRGYTAGAAEKLSEEGKILTQSMTTIKFLARDGFLSLHEDPTADYAYLYSYEDAAQPGPVTVALADVLDWRIGLYPDPQIDEICDGESFHVDFNGGKGIIFNDHLYEPDSSLETALHTQFNIRAHVTETGGQCSIENRIATNADLVREYIHTNAREHAARNLNQKDWSP